jgi:hypothetical protein
MLLNKKLSVAASALAAVLWCAAPADAQQRGHGGDQKQERGQSQGQSRGGGERRAQPAPQGRPEAQRPAPPAAPQRVERQQQVERPPQQVAPQRFGGGAQPRQQGPTQMQRPAPVEQRAQGSRQAPSVQTYRGGAGPAYNGNPTQAYRGGATPDRGGATSAYRGSATPAYRGSAPESRNAVPAYHGGGGSNVRSYGYGASRGYYTSHYYSQPHYVVHPYYVRHAVFVQPYYTFRPYFSLSIGGFYVGYGVPYPFSYWDPYAFYNYNLGIQSGYNYRTYESRVGGISFDIDPYDAEVYVDGSFVGYASDFDPSQMPLTLQSGRHHLDLSSPGYQDVSFDITVVPGQVIPYQGSLPYGH